MSCYDQIVESTPPKIAQEIEPMVTCLIKQNVMMTTIISTLLLSGCRDDGFSFASLQAELAQHHAEWTARVTTPALVGDQMRFSFEEDDDAHRAFSTIDWVTGAPPIGSLPSVHDWRDVNGRSYVAPVQNQGLCGACVSFAALATLETALNIQTNVTDTPWVFSRQHVFSCGGGRCRNGWYLSDAVKHLQTTGAPDDSCLRYGSSDGQDVPCGMGCSDAPERSLRIAAYEQPTNGFVDVNAIKQALLKGPLITSMIIYDDFLLYSAGVYRHVTGRKRGSHAFMLIGWDDHRQAWIGRNSMGFDWGMDGDFYISWHDKDSLPGRYTYRLILPEHVPLVPVRTRPKPVR